MMEEQYKKVTAIITRLAAENPHITKEQIAIANSMYNGDTRPIEEIESELIAYSQNIAANASKSNVVEEPVKVEVADAKAMPEPTPEQEPAPAPEPEVYEPLKVNLPGDDKKKELQQMINDALGDMPTVPERTATETRDLEKPKQYVKEQSQPVESSSEAGYGNVIALLSLTIMFSIVTIIIAAFTILAN